MDRFNEKKGESLTYSGSGKEYAFLMLKNIRFTLLTLGLYAAWGRTNTRRYVWGATSFMGDRAAYTGKGIELFRGWVMILGIYLIGYFIVTMLSKYVAGPIGLLIIPFYAYTYALVIYGGTRYRLSKTTWRGIRFGVDKDKESTRAFVKLVIKYGLLTIFTLGFCLPWLIHEIRTFLINKSRFGSSYFHYEADRKAFSSMYRKNLFLVFITLGFYGPWFHVKLLKHRLEHTKFQGATFKLNLTGKDYFLFTWGSFIGTLLTFCLATPWLLNWKNRLLINAVEVIGDIDFASIANLESSSEAIADVAATEYDVDLAF